MTICWCRTRYACRSDPSARVRGRPGALPLDPTRGRCPLDLPPRAEPLEPFHGVGCGREGTGQTNAVRCDGPRWSGRSPPSHSPPHGWSPEAPPLVGVQGAKPPGGFQGRALTFVTPAPAVRHERHRRTGAAQGGRAPSARPRLFRRRHRHARPAGGRLSAQPGRPCAHSASRQAGGPRSERVLPRRPGWGGTDRYALGDGRLQAVGVSAAGRRAVRFVGEPVAMCLAATRAEAEDLAERVEVDYAELPAIASSAAGRAPARRWCTKTGATICSWKPPSTATSTRWRQRRRCGSISY